jgi:hypothetical protein
VSVSFLKWRLSDSPYIEMVWHGLSGPKYDVICPADSQWHFLLIKHDGRVKVSVEGPLTHALPKTQPEGLEFLVIKFKLGIFMPYFPVTNLVNNEFVLPEGSSTTFWLNGSIWELPTFENAESFVERLAREDLLVCDPVIDAVLQSHPQELSDRTLRRRFLQATGLTHGTIHQIERAKQAADLLGRGASILDVVFEVGYADQPHLTRSLKKFYGQTPAQILRMGEAD